jgi:hypothetical protein
MNWSFFSRWFPKANKEPLLGIYKVKDEELSELKCQRCKTALAGQPLSNQGGGPFVTCPKCKSRYYLRGY